MKKPILASKKRKSIINTEPEIDSSGDETLAKQTITRKKPRMLENMSLEEIDALSDEEADLLSEKIIKYVINNQTSNYTLGQLALRNDAVGRAARSEREKRWNSSNKSKRATVSKSDAYRLLHKHIIKGGSHRNLQKIVPTLATASPKKIAKSIKQAVADVEKAKAEKRKEKEIIKRALHDDKIRQRKEKRDALKKADLEKKAEQKIKNRLAKELVSKSASKKSTATSSSKKPVAKTKKTAAASTLKPSSSAPEKVKVQTPHTQVKAAPAPVVVPPPVKVIQQQKKVIRGHDGQEYDDQTHYLAKNGSISTWSRLHSYYHDGELPPDHLMPDPLHYKDDSRAAPPDRFNLFLNKKLNRGWRNH